MSGNQHSEEDKLRTKVGQILLCPLWLVHFGLLLSPRNILYIPGTRCIRVSSQPSYRPPSGLLWSTCHNSCWTYCILSYAKYKSHVWQHQQTEKERDRNRMQPNVGFTKFILLSSFFHPWVQAQLSLTRTDHLSQIYNINFWKKNLHHPGRRHA